MAVQYANHKELRRIVYKVLANNPRGMHLDSFINSINPNKTMSKEDLDHVGDMLQCMKKHNYVKYDQSRKYLQADTNFLIRHGNNGNNGNNYRKSFKKPQNSPYNINKSNN